MPLLNCRVFPTTLVQSSLPSSLDLDLDATNTIGSHHPWGPSNHVLKCTSVQACRHSVGDGCNPAPVFLPAASRQAVDLGFPSPQPRPPSFFFHISPFPHLVLLSRTPPKTREKSTQHSASLWDTNNCRFADNANSLGRIPPMLTAPTSPRPDAFQLAATPIPTPTTADWERPCWGKKTAISKPFRDGLQRPDHRCAAGRSRYRR